MAATRCRNAAERGRIVVAGVAAIAALVSAGCGTDSPRGAGAYLAEYVPVAIKGVDTDVIFPRIEGASRFLVRNWPPMQTLEGDTLWVHGKWARVGFVHVADAAPTFVVEARAYAHPDAPGQTLTVVVNGSVVEQVRMSGRWRTYELELPVELVAIGWNEVELRFSQALRPADFDAESDDRRTLAAEFRRVEIHGGGRPRWAGRPEEISLAATPDDIGGAATDADTLDLGTLTRDRSDDVIEMPADSFLEAYVSPGRNVEILGSVEAEFAVAGETGTIRAVIEVLEPAGELRLWEAELSRTMLATEVRADLSPWAGQVIGLRIRVYGTANGVVRWRGLGASGPTVAADTFARPDALVAPPRSGALGRPDVFVVLLDAARADVFAGDLGAELAPNVQALGREGTTFTRAWAPSSWTGQSVPALWSGMIPDAIGIRHWGSRIPPRITTFPELLGDAGYDTTLWSQHNIYRARPPLRQGFDAFEEATGIGIRAREVLPSLADVGAADAPSFVMIHLLPPHDPYRPPAPFSGTRSGWYSGDLRIDATTLNELDILIGPEHGARRDEVRRAARAMYEENVQFADHLVGRLVDDLKRQDRYEEALIIVLSDHGEAFYEHGRFLHMSAVFEEFLRIPLIIKWPRSFGGFRTTVDAPVSLIDIAPTLVDGLGIEDPRALYQGRSLLPMVRGEPPPHRILYAATSGASDPAGVARPKQALLWNDVKLLHDADAGTTALYRLSEDPAETVDVAAREPFYDSWLRQVLRLTEARNADLLLRLGGALADDLDPDTIRDLRALGYLR